jgi:hypothetical protein
MDERLRRELGLRGAVQQPDTVGGRRCCGDVPRVGGPVGERPDLAEDASGVTVVFAARDANRGADGPPALAVQQDAVEDLDASPPFGARP